MRTCHVVVTRDSFITVFKKCSGKYMDYLRTGNVSNLRYFIMRNLMVYTGKIVLLREEDMWLR